MYLYDYIYIYYRIIYSQFTGTFWRIFHDPSISKPAFPLAGRSSEIDSELSGEEIPEKEPSLRVTPQLLADLGDSPEADGLCVFFLGFKNC